MCLNKKNSQIIKICARMLITFLFKRQYSETRKINIEIKIDKFYEFTEMKKN